MSKRETQPSIDLKRLEVSFFHMGVQRKTVQIYEGSCVLQGSQRPGTFLAFCPVASRLWPMSS